MISNITHASDQAIKNSLARLKPVFQNDRSWVHQNNRYLTDATRVVINDCPSNLNSNDISDYISCSSFIHCFNAWNYLSNSINALLEGDYGGAIHNAYYAELRSMMAFLASQGIGVFSGENIILDGGGIANAATFNPVNNKGRFGKTHEFAKTALDEWMTISTNNSQLLAMVSVETKTLPDWIAATGLSPESAAIFAKDWIKSWSIDMSLIGADHNIRNHVSYRPQQFDLTFSHVIDRPTSRINLLRNIWEISQPGDLFERHLLRATYEHLYNEVYQYPDLTHLTKDADLIPIFARTGLTFDDVYADDLIKFLRRETPYERDNPIFDFARSGFPNPLREHDVEPSGIISRATLLTNFVTLSVRSLMNSTRTSRADLNFWFNYLGNKMGIWKPGDEPSLFSDLWTDLRDEFETISAWPTPPQTATNFYLKTNLLNRLSLCRNFSRAYLWRLEK